MHSVALGRVGHSKHHSKEGYHFKETTMTPSGCPPGDNPLFAHTGDDIEMSGSELQNGKNRNGPQAEPTKLISRVNVIALLVVLVGVFAFVIIATFGVMRLRDNEKDHFAKISSNIAGKVESTWRVLLLSSMWLHQSGNLIDGLNYTEIIEACTYTEPTGIQAIGFASNVSTEARNFTERRTVEYLEANYNDVDYKGFSGYELDGSGQNMDLRYRVVKPFYFPFQFVSPVFCNEDAIDFDLLSMNATRTALEQALSSNMVVATQRIGPTEDPRSVFSSAENSILIFNPGKPGSPDHYVSVVVVRIPLFLLACSGFHEPAYTYLYDFTDGDDSPVFLGAALHDPNAHGGTVVQPRIKTGCRTKRKNHSTSTWSAYDNVLHEDYGEHKEHTSISSPEIAYKDLHSRSQIRYELDMNFASRQWKLVIVAQQGATDPNFAFVFLGGATIFVACLCLALWIYTDHRKEVKISSMKAASEEERAALLIDAARKSATKERELNDFIAHEVRNPLSAALSACSFVSSAVNEVNPLVTDESRIQVREDISVINKSLHFMNDLLRSMLDVHRAASKELTLELAPTDLLVDVLEPTASMVHQRGANFETQVVCPENLIIMTDRLRLRQIVLNLGQNATKFVQQGFIRFRASVTPRDKVIIYVEDSGCGVPEDKRENLLSKFEESLGSMNHETGVGLSVCSSIVSLMGGSLRLDDTYVSGMEGCPGSRFIVDPNAPIIRTGLTRSNSTSETKLEHDSICDASNQSLPERLSILFVDDDMMLRKLFSRSVKRLAPRWQVDEASNGETALKMVESNNYDLIFLDHYMASIDTQLLGTDTARALRGKGINCLICGLSANDRQQAFLEAGANAFIIKPFPCATESLKKELLRVLASKGKEAQNMDLKSDANPL